jgi:hypothetical protein
MQMQEQGFMTWWWCKCSEREAVLRDDRKAVDHIIQKAKEFSCRN